MKTIDRNERQLWIKGQYSVIVAKVERIKALDRSRDQGTHSAISKPLVTLAGTLDPTVKPELTVELYAETFGTSVRAAPPQGAIILTVLNGDDFITSDICTFMPGDSALVVVTGLDDPKVLQTIEKLRQVRHPPEPKAPRTRLATQPAK